MMELLIADAIEVIRVIVFGTGVVFFLFSIEEFALFATWLVYRWWRGRYFYRDHRPLSENLLLSEPQQHIAMMVPAWDESAVIGIMLRTALRNIDYDRYRIFVGVYPNDPKTQEAVAAVSAEDDRVQAVLLRDPGPTTKADCLNQVLETIGQDEVARGITYAAVVMNDAEDLIPPLELRLFNLLIPRKDIVQLPVFPLPMKWWQLTTGHYMDEFASLHTRSLPLREWLTGAVPSAGVGTGFSRRALALAAESNGGRAFDESSLTEDYELAMRISGKDVPEVFVIDPIRRRRIGLDRRYFNSVIAVKSYFPKSFKRAIRQKTRWIMGNVLQGWVRLGWRGSFPMRYAFLRDRKVLLGHLAVGVTYIAFAVTVLIWIVRWAMTGEGAFPDVMPQDPIPRWIVLMNIYFMIAYAAIRAYSTFLVYGLFQAFMSVPRLFWGSFINCLASVRAVNIFLFRKGTVHWDKTDHEFPDQ